MTGICLVDTSVLCELLAVPGMCADRDAVVAEMQARMDEGELLLLPMATILETGNHIGQNGDGGQRRRAALGFVRFVRAAIKGEAPFTATPFPVSGALLDWLDGFPDWASRSDAKGKGSGLGDLSIVAEWTRQCALHPARRVSIWSKDQHLAGYDRVP